MKPRNVTFSIVMALIMIISAIFTTPVQAQGATGDMAKLFAETVPDGSVMTPNQQFTKCWTIVNKGSTVWTNKYVFAYVSGDLLSAPNSVYNLPANVDRENTVQMCVNFISPIAAGRYRSVWQMKDASGNTFPFQFYVEIVVRDQGNNLVVGSTPEPKNFDFKEISSSKVEIYYNGEWIEATPGPYYTVKDDTASIKFYYYNVCHTKYYVENWSIKSKQECTKQYRSIKDSGLEPAISISEEGTYQFYSYMRGLTSINLMANISAQGMVQGINGYQAIDIGSAATAKFQALTRSVSRAGPLLMVVSFIVVAERVWVITYPIQPIPVATAPATFTALAAIIASQELRLAHSAKVVDGKTEGEMTDEVTKTTARWMILVKNGMCWGSIRTEHLRTDENGNPKFITIDQDLNENQPGKAFSCEEWDIFLMFVHWAQQAAYKLLSKAEFYFVLQRLFDRFVADLKLTTLTYGDLWAMLRGVLFGE